MLEWIRKFDLRKAGICGVVIGGINIILHILVIANIIPYLWVMVEEPRHLQQHSKCQRFLS